MSRYPEVIFRVGRRRVPSTTLKWLEQKKRGFEKMWKRYGSDILRRIERACGIGFPKMIQEEGIEVWLQRWKREDGDYVGDMIETEPRKLTLYLRKNDTWKSVKDVIVHELIHCLMWQVYYYDLRRREVTLFEDYFADELLASLVEKTVLGTKLTRKQCVEALDYAMSEMKLRLGRKKHHKKLIGSIIEFMKRYQQRVRRKRSNILRERSLLVSELPSPLPITLDDL